MVQFDEAPRGYHKGQVEEYLTFLSGEYQKLLEELEAAQRTQELQEAELRRLKQTKGSMTIQTNGQEMAGSEQYVEAIVSALVTAEATAKQVIDEARTEARKMTICASRELQDIMQTKEAALNDLRRLSGVLSEMLEQLEESRNREEEYEILKMIDG